MSTLHTLNIKFIETNINFKVHNFKLNWGLQRRPQTPARLVFIFVDTDHQIILELWNYKSVSLALNHNIKIIMRANKINQNIRKTYTKGGCSVSSWSATFAPLQQRLAIGSPLLPFRSVTLHELTSPPTLKLQII